MNNRTLHKPLKRNKLHKRKSNDVVKSINEYFISETHSQQKPKQNCKINLNSNGLPLFNNPKKYSNTYSTSNKILFTEKSIQDILTEFDTFNLSNKESVTDRIKQTFVYLDPCVVDDSYKYFENNVKKTLFLKYFIQMNKEFFYVPYTYISSDKESHQDLISDSYLKLFENNCNTLKDSYFQYQAINSNDTINYDLAHVIKDYLRCFEKNKFRKKSQALLIYTQSEIIDSIKVIEAVCNELNYYILKFDELENHKNVKIISTYEATKSHRIKSVNDVLLDKIDLLEKIIREEPTKLSNITNSTVAQSTTNINLNFNINLNINISSNQTNMDDKTEYLKSIINSSMLSNNNFNSVNPENLSIIKNNIYKKVLTKENLILIIDSAFADEGCKNYINTLIPKLSKSMCPYILLAGNNFKLDNLNMSGDKTDKLLSKAFSIKYSHANCDRIQINLIMKVHYVLFLHIILDECVGLNISEQVSPLVYLKELISSYTMRLNQINETSKLFQESLHRISELAIFICLRFKFNEDGILYYIKNTLRFNSHKFKSDVNNKNEDIELVSLINHKVDIIYDKIKFEQHTLKIGINCSQESLDSLISICNMYDESSILDIIETKSKDKINSLISIKEETNPLYYKFDKIVCDEFLYKLYSKKENDYFDYITRELTRIK